MLLPKFLMKLLPCLVVTLTVVAGVRLVRLKVDDAYGQIDLRPSSWLDSIDYYFCCCCCSCIIFRRI